MTELTFAAIEAEVRRLVAADPDHVYRKGEPQFGDGSACYYSTRTPGAVEACLFGQALANLGVTDMGEYEGRPIWDVVQAKGVVLTMSQREWLGTLQGYQDAFWSWSGALSTTDAQWPEVRQASYEA